MIYYRLRCNTCSEDFQPIRATQEGELLFPVYDDCEQEVGRFNTDALHAFHQKHRGHDLVEVPDEPAAIRAWRSTLTDSDLLTFLDRHIATDGPLILHYGYPKGEKTRGLACGPSGLRDSIKSMMYPPAAAQRQAETLPAGEPKQKGVV